MKVSFHGAARSVTGSRHLIETSSSRILLDCGLFQGRREEAAHKNRDLGFDPKALSAVLLSHAHIDHSGALPVLAQHGFSGQVYLTRATADLAAIMLQDAARLQESDCSYVNKKERRRGQQCVRPLFASDDVESITRRVLHHLKHAIEDEANIIVFVGFQAEHTLGRKLVEGWDVVPIFGVPTPRRAQIVKLNGLSAHADRNDLFSYVRAIHPLPNKVFIVHGEEKQALSLGAAIQAEHPTVEIQIPHRGSSHEL